MARTLVGNLILRMRDELSARARGAVRSIRDVERAASEVGRGLRNAPAPWGANFQRQLDRLKLTRDEFREVGRSWDALQRRIRQNSMNQALRASSTATWRTSVLGHFSDVRAGMRQTEQRFAQMQRRMASPMRWTSAALGLGTGYYVVGRAGREGFRAAGERGRREYQYELANIPQTYSERVREKSQSLAKRYGAIDQSEIMELGRVGYTLFGGREDHALAMLEPIVRNIVATMTEQGPQAAADRVRSFLRAMDQANRNELLSGLGPENIAQIMEGAVKAAQVEGKEIRVEDYLAFSQTANVARYALTNDFWSSYLPALMQDQGAGRMGQILAGAYRNLVTPIGAGPQARYLQRQQAMGLRDENQTLIGRDLFVQNPFEWAHTYFKPLLEKQGVDITNEGEVAEAVGRVMSHRLAAGGMTAMIIASENIRKNIEMYSNALGSSDAENARHRDPFIAFSTFLASLRDLSAELGTHVFPVIIPALNRLSDGIRNFAERIKGIDSGWSLGLGIAATAGGAVGAWKLASATWGLITAGAALKASAAALTAAAVAQGGAGVAGSAAGAAAGAGRGGSLRHAIRGGWRKGLVGGALYGLGRFGIGWGLDTVDEALGIEGRDDIDTSTSGILGRFGDRFRDLREGSGSPDRTRGRRNAGRAGEVGPNAGRSLAEAFGLDGAQKDAEKLKDTLSAPNKLNLDKKELEEALSIAQRLANVLQSVPGLSRAARDEVDDAADRTMRSAYSDYGVVP